MANRTIYITLAVTVSGAPEERSDQNDNDLLMRVLNTVVPHPDSALATDLSGERVTVLAVGYEVTS